MSTIRWAVLRDKYPFGIGEMLGIVAAPDRKAALAAAAAQFTGAVVVQSLASRTVALRELSLPAPTPDRDQYGLKTRDRRPYMVQRRKTATPRVKPAQLPIGERPGDYQAAKRSLAVPPSHGPTHDRHTVPSHAEHHTASDRGPVIDPGG